MTMTKFHLPRSGADERETLMNAPAIKHTTVPAPIDVLTLRAWAQAFLWWAGEYQLAEAVDPLQEFAERAGLVAQLGADAVQRIIAEEFQERAQRFKGRPRYESAA